MPDPSDPSIASGGSNEFFYLDEHGQKQDAELHEEMLDNPEADDWSARKAIADALGRGMNLSEALSAYATDKILEENGLPPRGTKA